MANVRNRIEPLPISSSGWLGLELGKGLLFV